VQAVLAANTPKFAGVVPPDAEELLEQLIVFGTPAEARRRLQRWHAAGAVRWAAAAARADARRDRFTLDAFRPLLESSARPLRRADVAGKQKTGRERVVAAYKGEFADCVPAYPIAGSFAGCLDGLSIEEYCTNPKKAVKAMINYYERYQPDIMVAFNDLAKEGEAVGCHVKYSDYVVPSIDEHVLQDDKGLLARLEVPIRSGRPASRLPRAVRGALGAEVPQRARRGAGGAVDDRDAHAQSRAHVPGHARRSGVRPRPHALLHRVRQAGGRRRARPRRSA
jgi:hypothetical protein